MDFLENFFSFENIVLGIVGIIGIVGLVAALRIMRQGRQSYSSRHASMDARIKETQQTITDGNNAMLGQEQLHILAVTLRDAIELKGYECTGLIEEKEKHLLIKLKTYPLSIHYSPRTTRLKSIGKTVHGEGLWEVRTEHEEIQSFANLMELERYVLMQIFKDLA